MDIDKNADADAVGTTDEIGRDLQRTKQMGVDNIIFDLLLEIEGDIEKVRIQ
jgi:hypothetical protein